jgi:hypothetical protein
MAHAAGLNDVLEVRLDAILYPPGKALRVVLGSAICAKYSCPREEQKKRQICQKMMSVGWMILVGTMIVLPSNEQASSLRLEKEL